MDPDPHRRWVQLDLRGRRVAGVRFVSEVREDGFGPILKADRRVHAQHPGGISMFQHFSKWLIEWLTREVPKERDCGRFITVRANGSAHFDVVLL